VVYAKKRGLTVLGLVNAQHFMHSVSTL